MSPLLWSTALPQQSAEFLIKFRVVTPLGMIGASIKSHWNGPFLVREAVATPIHRDTGVTNCLTSPDHAVRLPIKVVAEKG
jgi:hypothetical protein